MFRVLFQFKGRYTSIINIISYYVDARLFPDLNTEIENKHDMKKEKHIDKSDG